MTDQCGTCAYYVPFYHWCAKRRLNTFLEACDSDNVILTVSERRGGPNPLMISASVGPDLVTGYIAPIIDPEEEE